MPCADFLGGLLTVETAARRCAISLPTFRFQLSVIANVANNYGATNNTYVQKQEESHSQEVIPRANATLSTPTPYPHHA